MEIESLENSPGNTLKRKIDVTVMSESPAPRRRLESGGARLEDAPPRSNMNPQVSVQRSLSSVVRHVTLSSLQDASISYTNGHSKPSSVEITLAGRARSREDLCPDPRPKSRYDLHSVLQSDWSIQSNSQI